jgi:hypothetical protein
MLQRRNDCCLFDARPTAKPALANTKEVLREARKVCLLPTTRTKLPTQRAALALDKKHRQ